MRFDHVRMYLCKRFRYLLLQHVTTETTYIIIAVNLANYLRDIWVRKQYVRIHNEAILIQTLSNSDMLCFRNFDHFCKQE